MLDAPNLTEGTVVGGDYRIVRPLAEGGMGRVYLVEQISTRKQRALKVLRPALTRDAKMRERFVREAVVSARIESDHVVEVLGAGVDEETGTPWLAMEYLQGSDLGAIGAERGALPPEEVREIFAQLCHALGAAHRVGVVHRDLKPENVFVARTRRSDVPFTVKLLDFGIARFVQDAGPVGSGDATAPLATTSAIGSPLWMAPEQLNLQPVSPATDVWALGLLAFWALTGRSYWRTASAAGTSIEAVLAEKLFAPIESASARAAEYGLADKIPQGFDAWFAKCVARDPTARYRDAEQSHRVLGSVLGDRDSSTPSVPKPATAERVIAATPSTSSLSNVEIPRRRPPAWTVASLSTALVAAAIAAVAWRGGPRPHALRALHGPPVPHVEPTLDVTPPHEPPTLPPEAPTTHPPSTPEVDRATHAARVPAHDPPRAPAPSPSSLAPGTLGPEIRARVRIALDAFDRNEDRAEASDSEADHIAATQPVQAAILRGSAARLRVGDDNTIENFDRQSVEMAAVDPAAAAMFRELARQARLHIRARRTTTHAP